MVDLRVRGQATHFDANNISVRCPACRQVGTFHGVGVRDIGWNNPAILDGAKTMVAARAGLRLCPNPNCNSVLFVFSHGKSIQCFPPETIDFDAANLPAGILSSLEEAISCHAAGCYRASALMVRRTLEELCDDKAATGKDLKARIAALSSIAIIPGDLLTAADELRILGNDAAHIEAKNYDGIGMAESALAIELAKELLKAVYQYASLVARLTALKKSP